MAGRLMDVPSRHGRAPSPSAVGGLGWLPVALGSAVIVAGLGKRRQSTVALALTAVASVAAAAALQGIETDREQRSRREPIGEPKAERSITIRRTADELRRHWRDPFTLPRVMAGLASVQATGDGRMRWSIEAPTGRTYEWETETVEHGPGGSIGWRSLPGASIPNQGSVRFSPAPGDRGTVATLQLRFDPPGGALGDFALGVLGHKPIDLAVEGVLRRFKSLVETGEIPTTERQPAARADPR